MKTNGILSGVVSRWEWDRMARKVKCSQDQSECWLLYWALTGNTSFNVLPSTVRMPDAGPLLSFPCFIWWVISCLFSLQIKKRISQHQFFFFFPPWWVEQLIFPNDSMTLWPNAPSLGGTGTSGHAWLPILTTAKQQGGVIGRTFAFLKLIFKTGHTSFLGVPFLEITISDTQ